jgi:hypothetical protein
MMTLHERLGGVYAIAARVVHEPVDEVVDYRRRAAPHPA